jgi:hypothetical protein
VLEAAFWAFCWRPRAWPPFFPAAFREAALREAEPLVDDLDLELDFEPDLLPPPLCAIRISLLEPAGPAGTMP